MNYLWLHKQIKSMMCSVGERVLFEETATHEYFKIDVTPIYVI